MDAMQMARYEKVAINRCLNVDVSAATATAAERKQTHSFVKFILNCLCCQLCIEFVLLHLIFESDLIPIHVAHHNSNQHTISGTLLLVCLRSDIPFVI